VRVNGFVDFSATLIGIRDKLHVRRNVRTAAAALRIDVAGSCCCCTSRRRTSLQATPFILTRSV